MKVVCIKEEPWVNANTSKRTIGNDPKYRDILEPINTEEFDGECYYEFSEYYHSYNVNGFRPYDDMVSEMSEDVLKKVKEERLEEIKILQEGLDSLKKFFRQND